MFGLTWKLFALLSLVLPILAATIPVRKEAGELEMRDTHNGGRVRLSRHPLLMMLTFWLIGNLVHTWPR